jgi:hypothetical protein
VSEFSESHHLATTDQAEGVSLLERSGLAGWVFPPSAAGWTAVVPEAPFTSDPSAELLGENVGVLLYYLNAEDHGWGLAAYDGPELVFEAWTEWDDEVTVRGDPTGLPALWDLLGDRVPDESRLPLAGHLFPDPSEHERLVDLVNPGHHAARLLGLDPHEWVSGEPELAEEHALRPGVVRVDG